MNILDVIVIGLCSWRLASMLVSEAGPFDIFEKFRDFVGANATGELSGLGKLFNCIYCVTVWTTIISAVAFYVEPIVVMLVAAMSVSLVVNYFAKIE